MSQSAVIGGGVLGLAIAQRLRSRGDNVSVFEAAETLGGLAAPWELDRITWDRHQHVVLGSDTRTRQLLRSVGLEHQLRWARASRGLYLGPNTGPQAFSSALDFARLNGLTPFDKLRLTATLVGATRARRRGKLDTVGAEAWLTRWSGRRTFDRLWAPMLRAKLGDAGKDASAAFVASTIGRLHAARRGLWRGEQLGYLDGGYARALDCYQMALSSSGVKINAGAPVRRVVAAEGGGLQVQLDDGSATFDRVVITTSAPVAAALCPGLEPSEHELLRAIRYVGVINASMLLRISLSRRYLTYVADPATPFAAAVEMSALTGTAAFGGYALVYLPRYTDPKDELFDADDDTIRAQFLPSLQCMYPRLREEDIVTFRVAKARQVFTVPSVGDARSMPPVTTSVPGLQIIGSANLPHSTPNVNDTLSLLQELR